jgi:hypothetical protein
MAKLNRFDKLALILGFLTGFILTQVLTGCGRWTIPIPHQPPLEVCNSPCERVESDGYWATCKCPEEESVCVTTPPEAEGNVCEGAFMDFNNCWFCSEEDQEWRLIFPEEEQS